MNRKSVLETLYDIQEGVCASCGKGMYLPKRHPTIINEMLYASVDHLEARSEGGSDDITNKVAMHRSCNSAKMSRAPTGCERIFQALIHAYFEIVKAPKEEAKATLADIWPM